MKKEIIKNIKRMSRHEYEQFAMELSHAAGEVAETNSLLKDLKRPNWYEAGDIRRDLVEYRNNRLNCLLGLISELTGEKYQTIRPFQEKCGNAEEVLVEFFTALKTKEVREELRRRLG